MVLATLDAFKRKESILQPTVRQQRERKFLAIINDQEMPEKIRNQAKKRLTKLREDNPPPEAPRKPGFNVLEPKKITVDEETKKQINFNADRTLEALKVLPASTYFGGFNTLLKLGKAAQGKPVEFKAESELLRSFGRLPSAVQAGIFPKEGLDNLNGALQAFARPELLPLGYSGGEIARRVHPKLWPVAGVLGGLLEYASFVLTFSGPKGVVRDIKALGKLPKAVKEGINVNKLRILEKRSGKAINDAVEESVKILDKQGYFPKDWNQADKIGRTKIFLQENVAINNRRKFPDFLSAEEKLGKAVTNKDFLSEKLFSKSGKASLKDFKKGDPLRVGNETLKFVNTKGAKANFINQAGKKVSMSLEEAERRGKAFGELSEEAQLGDSASFEAVMGLGSKDFKKAIKGNELLKGLSEKEARLTIRENFEESGGSLEKPPIVKEVTGKVPSFNLRLDSERGGALIDKANLKTVQDIDNALETINQSISEGLLPIDIVRLTKSEIGDTALRMQRVLDAKDQLLDHKTDLLLAEKGLPPVEAQIDALKKRKRGIRKPEKTLFNLLQKNPVSLGAIRGNQDAASVSLKDSLKGNRAGRARQILRGKGMSIQQAAEMAKDHGFITQQDLEENRGVLIDAFLNKLDRAISGEKILSENEFFVQQEKKAEAERRQYLKDNAEGLRTDRIVQFRTSMEQGVIKLNAATGSDLPMALEGVEAVLQRFVPTDRQEQRLLQLPKVDWWRNQIKETLKPYKDRVKEFNKKQANFEEFQVRKAELIQKYKIPMEAAGRITQKDFFEAMTRMVQRTGHDMNHMTDGDVQIAINELGKQIRIAELNKSVEAVASDPVVSSIAEDMDRFETIDRVKARVKAEEKTEKLKDKLKKGGTAEILIEEERVQAPNINLFDDARINAANIQKLGNGNFHVVYESLRKNYLLAQNERLALEQELEVFPIDRLTQRDRRLMGKVLSGDLPESTFDGAEWQTHRGVMQFIKGFYETAERRAMAIRVYQYIYNGDLPAQAGVDVAFKQARDIFLIQGDDAVMAWVDNELANGRKWGLVEGYNPREAFKTGIVKDANQATWVAIGRTRFMTREGFSFTPDERRDPIAAFHSYMRQLFSNWYLKDDVHLLEYEWDKVARRFGNKSDIQQGWEGILNAMKGVSEWTSGFEKIAVFTARLGYNAIFMGPKLMYRNLFQVFVTYPNTMAYIKFISSQSLRGKTATPERLDHFNKFVPQDLKKHLLELGNPVAIDTGNPVLDKANTYLWKIGGLYQKTDSINRWATFFTKMYELDLAFNQVVGVQGGTEILKDVRDVIMEQSFFKGATVAERKYGAHIFANTPGGIDEKIEAFKRYIAERTVLNTQWVYDRAQRSANEQGMKGRIYGNMITFGKSTLLTLIRDGENVARYGMESKEGKQAAWNMFWHGFLGSYLANTVFGLTSGDDKSNPYNPLGLLKWAPGGILIGATVQVFEIIRATYQFIERSAVQDEDGANKEFNNLSKAVREGNNMFIPLYRMLVATIEATYGLEEGFMQPGTQTVQSPTFDFIQYPTITGTVNLDTVPFKKLREVFDIEYEHDAEAQLIERTYIEALQHAIFQTDPAIDRIQKEKKEFKKMRKARSALNAVRRRRGMKTKPAPIDGYRYLAPRARTSVGRRQELKRHLRK